MTAASTSSPTVSVVMITYNGVRFVREQIDSLLRQTYPFSELIVQDDCSTDSTCDIVREYARRDPRIHLFVNPENMGWNRNFMSAMQRATGDYIALCDQDDIWYEDNIEKKMAALGSASLVYCYRCLDPVYTRHGHNIRRPQGDFESLLFTSHIPGHSQLFSRRFLHSIDTWDERIAYDWWLAIQAHLHQGITVVEEPLNWYREHLDSASVVMMKSDWDRTKGNTWQPYVKGWAAYRAFQQIEVWQWLYDYIATHTTNRRHPVVHRMAVLLNQRSWLSLLRLCTLTMRYRRLVHRRFAEGRGWKRVMGMIRGFFYPLIWTYNNNTAFFETPRKRRP